MDQDAGVRHVRLTTGVSLAYTSTGPSSATPVLFLHAWAESRRSFDRLLALLPATVHAIAMDQRGHGESSRPSRDFDMRLEIFADDLIAVLDDLGIESATFVMAEFSSSVAIDLAARYPKRVRSLVLPGFVCRSVMWKLDYYCAATTPGQT